MKRERIWQYVRSVFGLPMVYTGIVLLGIHCFCRLASNILLLVAIVLEIIGIIGHYWKVKHA